LQNLDVRNNRGKAEKYYVRVRFAAEPFEIDDTVLNVIEVAGAKS
jgi:hypothetical protein